MEPTLGKPPRIIAAAVAIAAVALGAAGCGGGAVTAASGPASGELTISAPPGYIDPGKKGTVAEFEAKTGIRVDYREDVTDDERFFSDLQPSLEEGKSDGRSILIVSDWMAKQM